MAKYKYELKRKIVMEYLEGGGSYKELTSKYNISSESTVQKWVNAYQTLGDEGLLRSRRSNNYPVDFKVEVVQLYLTSELSYQSLANKYGMNNPGLITRWVLDYQEHGIDGLTPKRRGRPPIMSEKAKKTKNLKPITKVESQRLKEL